MIERRALFRALVWQPSEPITTSTSKSPQPVPRRPSRHRGRKADRLSQFASGTGLRQAKNCSACSFTYVRCISASHIPARSHSASSFYSAMQCDSHRRLPLPRRSRMSLLWASPNSSYSNRSTSDTELRWPVSRVQFMKAGPSRLGRQTLIAGKSAPGHLEDGVGLQAVCVIGIFIAGCDHAHPEAIHLVEPVGGNSGRRGSSMHAASVEAIPRPFSTSARASRPPFADKLPPSNRATITLPFTG